MPRTPIVAVGVVITMSCLDVLAICPDAYFIVPSFDDRFSLHFLVLWLYGKYLGKHDSVTMEQRYKTVVATLKKKKVTVFDSDKFEDSWEKICKILKLDPEPRLLSNRSGKDYKKIQDMKDCSDKFKTWHRSYISYDYLLYEQFCI